MQTFHGSIATLIIGLATLTVVLACLFREHRRNAAYRTRDDELRAREIQVQVVLQGGNDGYWLWRAGTGELEVSSRVYELLGYAPNEVESNLASFRAVIHPDDYETSRLQFLSHVRDLRPFNAHYRLRLKSGIYHWFSIHGRTVRDDRDLTLQTSGSIGDINDQKRAEEANSRHALQQGLTAELGQMALECEDMSALMSFTVSIVTRGLDCEFCRLLSADVDDRVLVLRGASGWNEEWSKRILYDATEETEDRFIIGVRHAIIVDDYLHERRYKPSDMLNAHGVRSGVEMLVCGAQDSYGVIGVYSRSAGQFNSESLVFLRGISNILASSMDRNLAQERLTKQELLSRESEERLRQITDNLPAMISYWDQMGICRFANEAHVRQIGVTAGAMAGRAFGDIFGPEFESARDAQVAVMKGERQLFDMCLQLEDRAKRHWQGEYLPHWSDDTVVGFYALIVDITQRKNSEERLVQQEALLSATGRMGEIGGWEQEIDQAVPQLSAMACRIHDLPAGATPDVEMWANFYPPESLKTVRRSITEAFELGKPFDYIVPFLTAAGRQRWIRSIGQPQPIDGKCVKIVGAIQDVTQQRRHEADLAQSQKLESIGQLAAGIAHEINTPIQFIGNNVSFVSDSVTELFDVLQQIRSVADRGASTVLAEELLETLQSIDVLYLLEEVPLAIKQSQDGIERIQKIVGAMKEFSHPSVEKTHVDINQTIDSTIVVASHEWKYVAEVVTDLAQDLPNVYLIPGSFNQVVLNLIVNAAHAISDVVDGGIRGKGVITISTRRVDDWVEVAIRDTGSGIPDKIRDRVFDPFFTTKPVGKGTGQGLSIAYEVVVKKHGGTISVESGVDGGTTFLVRLPLAPEITSKVAREA